MQVVTNSNAAFPKDKVDVYFRQASTGRGGGDLFSLAMSDGRPMMTSLHKMLASHKSLLSTHSNVFKALFEDCNSDETFQGLPVVEIAEDIEDFDCILEFLYQPQGTASKMTANPGNIANIYEIAGKYMIEDVQRLLEMVMVAAEPCKMGAGTLLAFSISMKEQKKTFVAERLEATLLKYGPQDLANPKFRLATRKLPMKEVIDLYEKWMIEASKTHAKPAKRKRVETNGNEENDEAGLQTAST